MGIGQRAGLTVVYGGGGPFGVAYGMAVAKVLAAAGLPLSGSTALGTSAGAWVAACTAVGIGFENLREVRWPTTPSLRPGLLREAARELLGQATSPLVRVSVCRFPLLRRRLLSGQDHLLADLVAASSAVPGLVAPSRVGRSLYVDGGLRSMASADQAPEARHLLVVAPVAGPMFGPAGPLMTAMLGDEMRRWEDRTGGRAHLIRPDAAVSRLARNPLDLFDRRRACEAFLRGQEQVAGLLDTNPDLRALWSAA